MSVACVLIEGEEVDRPGHHHNFFFSFYFSQLTASRFLVFPEATFKRTSSGSFMSPFQQKEPSFVHGIREVSLLHFIG